MVTLRLLKPSVPADNSFRDRSPSFDRRGETAVTTRSAKIIPFPSQRRHVRVRLTSTGEWLRLIAGGRKPQDDQGPRAA
jgi:hypothetical protein